MTIVLDSRGLQISGIQVYAGEMEAKPATFDVGEADPVKGEAIRIHLPDGFQGESEFLLKIDYQTGPDASALMWLPPGTYGRRRVSLSYSPSRSRSMPVAGCRCRILRVFASLTKQISIHHRNYWP